MASGIQGKNQIDEYVNKLDHLLHQFISKVTSTPDLLIKAKVLFDWLWEEKPARYKPHGSYQLDNIIDTQLSKESQIVGNCLGLTLLYNCLLRRMGIMAGALYLEDAFGIGPHVLTTLPTRDSSIDVENNLPNGYGYKGHLNHPLRIRWGDEELVADIYHSMGNDFFSKSEFNKALENYEICLRLNPNYERAYLNRKILLDKIEMDKKER